MQGPRDPARPAVVVGAVEPWILTTAWQLADAPLGETLRSNGHGPGEGGALGADDRAMARAHGDSHCQREGPEAPANLTLPTGSAHQQVSQRCL